MLVSRTVYAFGQLVESFEGAYKKSVFLNGAPGKFRTAYFVSTAGLDLFRDQLLVSI